MKTKLNEVAGKLLRVTGLEAEEARKGYYIGIAVATISIYTGQAFANNTIKNRGGN